MNIKVLTTIFLLVSTAGVTVALPMLTYDYSSASNLFKNKQEFMSRFNNGVVLLDRHGQPFYRLYQGRQAAVTPIEKIPDVTQKAIIAAEDKQFYSHKGFSFRATIASFIANIRHQEIAYGGSTITQQLVKNAILTPSKDFLRKYREIVLAREMERHYAKKDILEMYLNSAYFGEGAYGIEEAARIYFSKPVDQLNLAESSLLAGLLVAPSRLSPVHGNRDEAIERQKTVLEDMYKHKYISLAEKTEAENSPLNFNPQPPDQSPYAASHFAQMVQQELINRYGEESLIHSGLVVQTTVDLEWQGEAEKAVLKQVDKLKGNRVSNGSAVVIDPKTGEVLALVGSRDFSNQEYGQVNIATSLRQPGSTFKPIVYLAALEQRAVTPASILEDKPVAYQNNYKPENYDRRFRGPVTVRRALANSLNVPTVALQNKIGVASTLDMAKRLGLSTLNGFTDSDLSISLGSGETKLIEMTAAYATLANQGNYIQPALISSIKDREGKVIYQYQANPRPAVDSGDAFLISSILSDKVARKEIFGNSLDITRPAAVKTGTSQDYRDSWTIGYTPSLAVGVWVGNNNSKPMDQVAGSLGAAPIWKQLMEKFSTGTEIENFVPPDSVVLAPICPYQETGRGKWQVSSRDKEYFILGTEPNKSSCPTPKPVKPPEPTPIQSPAVSTSSPVTDLFPYLRPDRSTEVDKEVILPAPSLPEPAAPALQANPSPATELEEQRDEALIDSRFHSLYEKINQLLEREGMPDNL